MLKSGWGVREQRALLAATDVQVHDSDRGTGNTLIPADARPASYLESLSWAIERFQDGTLSQWRASSVRLSRSLEALRTSSEYLRQLDRGLSLTEERAVTTGERAPALPCARGQATDHRQARLARTAPR